MSNKDNRLLVESYQLILERKYWVNALLNNSYSQEQIDYLLQREGWEGVKKAAKRYLPAALGAAMTFNNAFAANTQREDPLSYAQDEPGMVEVQKDIIRITPQFSLDNVYNAIVNSDKILHITKEQIIRSKYEAKEAETYLKAMTPQQKNTVIPIYSVKATVEFYGENHPELKNSTCWHSEKWDSVFFSPNVLDYSKKEVIDLLTHELQHATDDVQTGITANDKVPVAAINQSSTEADYARDIVTPLEIRAHVAESRMWLGPIRSQEQFKQKWDEAQKEFKQKSADYSSKDFRNYYLGAASNSIFKVPEAFRRLVWFYNNVMASKTDQQKLYNYILKTALDNSVAKVDTSTAKNIS